MHAVWKAGHAAMVRRYLCLQAALKACNAQRNHAAAVKMGAIHANRTKPGKYHIAEQYFAEL